MLLKVELKLLLKKLCGYILHCFKRYPHVTTKNTQILVKNKNYIQRSALATIILLLLLFSQFRQ